MEQRNYREYIGNHLWAIANAAYSFGGKEIPSTPYSEIIHPEIVDNRSSDEIKAQLLRMLET